MNTSPIVGAGSTATTPTRAELAYDYVHRIEGERIVLDQLLVDLSFLIAYDTDALSFCLSNAMLAARACTQNAVYMAREVNTLLGPDSTQSRIARELASDCEKLCAEFFSDVKTGFGANSFAELSVPSKL